jgi:hypothetical protein
MIDFNAMERSGRPWAVTFQRASFAAAADTDIVIPPPAEIELSPQINPWTEQGQLIVTGFTFNYSNPGANQGISLSARVGTSTDQLLWQDISVAAGTARGAVTECYMPLRRTIYNVTPADRTAARLRIKSVGGGTLTNVCVVVWGVYKNSTHTYGRLVTTPTASYQL